MSTFNLVEIGPVWRNGHLEENVHKIKLVLFLQSGL